jgi:hypothetical protein
MPFVRIVPHGRALATKFSESRGCRVLRGFVDRPGVRNHFTTWSQDGKWIYFVSGFPAANEMDWPTCLIYRRLAGKSIGVLEVERVSHNSGLSGDSIQRVVQPTVTEDGNKAPFVRRLREGCIPTTVPLGMGSAQIYVWQAADHWAARLVPFPRLVRPKNNNPFQRVPVAWRAMALSEL